MAGVLTVAHWGGMALPCGADSGCDKVALDPSSKWFGIPVAVFGLGAYLLLAVLALWRIQRGLAGTRSLLIAGLTVSGIGTIASAILTFYALNVIKATCLWCLASAAIMTLTFVLYAILSQVELPMPTSKLLDQMIAAAGLFLSIGGIAYYKANMDHKATALIPRKPLLEKLQIADLVTDKRYLKGPETAKVTLVEYGDINCPACRQVYPKVEGIYQSAHGNLRIGFQHFPWFGKEGHDTSLPGAMISEIAKSKGKFWEFTDKMFAANSGDAASMDGVLALAKIVGLDTDEILRRLRQKDQALLDVVLENQRKGIQIAGVQVTPTFFIFSAGLPTVAATNTDIEKILTNAPYVRLLRANAKS